MNDIVIAELQRLYSTGADFQLSRELRGDKDEWTLYVRDWKVPARYDKIVTSSNEPGLVNLIRFAVNTVIDELDLGMDMLTLE